MNHIMPVFVKANMPLGQGGTLTDQEAGERLGLRPVAFAAEFDPSKLPHVTPAELKYFL